MNWQPFWVWWVSMVPDPEPVPKPEPVPEPVQLPPEPPREPVPERSVPEPMPEPSAWQLTKNFNRLERQARRVGLRLVRVGRDATHKDGGYLR